MGSGPGTPVQGQQPSALKQRLTSLQQKQMATKMTPTSFVARKNVGSGGMGPSVSSQGNSFSNRVAQLR